MLCQPEPGMPLIELQLSGTNLVGPKETKSVGFCFGFFFLQLWIKWSGTQGDDLILNVFRFKLLRDGSYCERSPVRSTCSYKRDWGAERSFHCQDIRTERRLQPLWLLSSGKSSSDFVSMKLHSLH